MTTIFPAPPSEEHSQRFVLEIVGFSDAEKSLLISTFRLTGRRAFMYSDLVPGERPDIYLINADNADAVRLLAETSPNRHAPAVLIGGEIAGIAWPLVERPIHWIRLFEQMDLVMRSALLERARRNLIRSPTWDGITLRRSRDARADVLPPPSLRPVESVLVVDDSATVRAFMRAKLAPFRFDVDYARDGESAVAMAEKRRYTCVFLDVMMPGIDGFEVCRRIKAIPQPGAEPPAVVMLTSKNGAIDKLRGNFSGADAWLPKPVVEDDLLATIARFLPSARKVAEAVLAVPAPTVAGTETRH